MVIFTLTLIRHGETDQNKRRIIQGQQDTELSQKGKRQAELAGIRLQYERFSHAYASDLKRAYNTCELILAANKFSTCKIVMDSRIRERKFGVFEGKSCELFTKEVRKCKANGAELNSFVPHGGESNKQVRQRAREFFADLCNKVKEVVDKEGNNSSGPPVTAGRRTRGTGSVCSNSSEVFVSVDSPIDNNNSTSATSTTEAHSELVLDSLSARGKHENSGSTSSTSGYSSGGTDSCEQLSPLEASQSPGANIPHPSDEGGFFQRQLDDSDRRGLVQNESTAGNSIMGNNKPTIKLSVPSAGCPNVSLSPVVEHRLMSIPSISSGRGSFDDTDGLLLAAPGVSSPDILLVSHGGLIKEMISYFVDELGCELPYGKEALSRTPYNTSVSKFTFDLSEDSKPKRVHCILLNEWDHLLGHDLEDAPLKTEHE